jgi:hypothetical protein
VQVPAETSWSFSGKDHHPRLEHDLRRFEGVAILQPVLERDRGHPVRDASFRAGTK